MSATLPPPDPARVAVSLGAQVALEPTSAAAQGAKGVYRHEALNLIHRAAGYIEMGLDPHDPNGTVPSAAPVNVAVPYAVQEGDVVTCTTGEWTAEPMAYSYRWTLDGVSAGADAASCTVTADDVGKTAVCVVSASNEGGTTAAPPSNGVVVVAPARR